jgi:hypothetical protein
MFEGARDPVGETLFLPTPARGIFLEIRVQDGMRSPPGLHRVCTFCSSQGRMGKWCSC